MQILNISGVKIDSVYTCIPELEIDNYDALKDIFKEGLDTVIKATGIRKRFIVNEGTSSLDLCCMAADKMLAECGVKRDEIGAVICVTFTPHNILPCNAVIAQSRLGLSNYIPAYDINLACSGYAFGLYSASCLVKALNKKVLLLDGDVQSVFTSKLDKSTLPVMADAGTCTLLSPDVKDVWNFTFYSDGSRREALHIPCGGSSRPLTKEMLDYIEYEDGSKRCGINIYMDGFEIFKFVAQDVSKLIKEFIAETTGDPLLFDAFVPHQANMYMINQLARKLKIPVDRMWESGDKYGNSASATIPVTISECAKSRIGNKDKIRALVSGFGGGLSVSIADITLYKDARYKVFKYNKDGE